MPRTKPKKPSSDRSRPAQPSIQEIAHKERSSDERFPVVGIGASAGGLEAFTALFRALPTDTGMAFIVVPHLAPAHTSSLAEILSRATSMPVAQVADDPRVEPNHVYVIPPGHDMVIAQRTLHLRVREPRAQQRSIDHFLQSLAEDQGDLAIGVILSGTASDGTVGLSAIKAEGGITFAQDDTAQQPSMPHSAIAEGSVDFVLPPQQIAQELARIAHHPRLAEHAPSGNADEPDALRDVLAAVHDGTGVDFTHYKANTLNRRVTRRMILQKVPNATAYAQMLRKSPREVEALHHDLLIGVTSFFRDPQAFDALKAGAFPRFISGDRGRDPVRIWVLGCSTGQEAYSLAMVLTEYTESVGVRVPIQIFASDLNAAAIDTARSGTYPKEIARDLSPDRLRRFFTEVDGHYRVIKTIRDMCVFSRQNVLVDPPFSRIDLVSCRNLLMYLEPVLQQQLLPILHYALKPTGVLWLGAAESIGSQKELFDTEDAKHKIFVKKPGVTHGSLFSLQRPTATVDAVPKLREAKEGGDVAKESDRVLLSRFAPAAVLVSPSIEILQYRGDVGPYVSPGPGRATLSLLKMLRNGLQVAVRAAVLRAKRDKAPAREEGVRFTRVDGHVDTATIEVVPLRAGEAGFLVLFDPDDGARPRPADTNRRRRRRPSAVSNAEQDVARLSKELEDTREYLQSVIEQQEASNEELQSANEEVQSANEELQSINEELETSKEEIQSSNEELSTVNDELQHRNEEVGRANSDLVNLLTSTLQVVVFVGRDLRVRRYTPAAESVLRLTPADIGRTIHDARLAIDLPGLEKFLTTTIDTLATSEQDVRDEAGHFYSLRVRPYRTIDNQIDGAVLQLVDVDVITRARMMADSIIATVREPLLVLDEEMRVVSANTAFYRTFQVDAQETHGRSLFELGDRQWDIPELRGALETILPRDSEFRDLDVVHDFPDIGRKAMALNARRLVQPSGARPLILLAIEDVTERKHAEGLRRERVAELDAADLAKNEFLAMLAHELRNPLAPIRTAAQILGMPGVPGAVTEKSRVVLDRQIQNMTRLIEDLLDVARISRGAIEMQMVRCDLVEIIRRAVDLAQHHLEERQQVIMADLPTEPWPVSCDPTRLEQALGNVLSNASKYTPRDGHIWVTAEQRNTEGHPSEAVVRIRDDGIGIAPDFLPHVFEMFKQGSGSPHHAPGLGVGLALVEKVVALHGGRVTVESAGKNQGSEFTIVVPLLDGDRSVEREPPPTLQSSAEESARRILVVDDNVDAADTLTTLLRLRKHDVRVVHDGRSALKMAAKVHPEIVFLDIAMPDMDGYEVARRLRRLPGLEDVLLVAVTGFGRPEDRQLALDAGFDEHVTKPLEPAKLPALLVPRQCEPH